MYRQKDYIIEFNKLKNGPNDLDFYVDGEFFKALSGGVIQQPADIKVHSLVNKSTNMYEVTFAYSGNIELPCDRCLEEMSWPVQMESHMIIKLSENESFDDDEIIYLTPQAISYDVAQHLYDYLTVGIFARHTCEMAGKDCAVKPEQLMSSAAEDESVNDPRWEKLKSLVSSKNIKNNKNDK